MTFYIEYSLTDLKKYDILTGQANAKMSDHSRWMPITSAKKKLNKTQSINRYEGIVSLTLFSIVLSIW